MDAREVLFSFSLTEPRKCCRRAIGNEYGAQPALSIYSVEGEVRTDATLACLQIKEASNAAGVGVPTLGIIMV
jgi:hypothetical protein